MELGYDNVRMAGWLHVYNEKSFDWLHRNCAGQMLSNGQYEVPGASCDICSASYVEGTWFNSESNPTFDSDGHKTGSGKWQSIEFKGKYRYIQWFINNFFFFTLLLSLFNFINFTIYNYY